jgi:hypothetical protein
MNFDGNEAKKEINVSNLSNGIYIVKAVISGKISISKFIKE